MKKKNNKIKVLFISHCQQIYGAEKSLLTLLANIDRQRVTPIVVIPGEGPLNRKIRQLNIKTRLIDCPQWVRTRLFILRLIKCAILEVVALSKLRKIIRKEKIDLVYTNSIVTLSGALAAFFTQKPHIWHIREILQRNASVHPLLPQKIFYKFISVFSRKIITNSIATSKQFQHLDLKEKITVVYDGVELKNNNGNSTQTGSEIGGIADNDWVAVMTGSIQKIKAQDDAICAVKIASSAIPNIKLLLVGESDGSYKTYLDDLAGEIGVSDKIIYAGYREDIRKILTSSKVLLMPSTNESLGRAAIEAMLAQIPVIAAGIGGLTEVVEDGNTGFLVNTSRPQEIAEKMVYIFNNPEISEKIAIAGKRFASKKFNAQKNARKTEEIIKNIICDNKQVQNIEPERYERAGGMPPQENVTNITICLATYNGAEYLKEQIESILAQSCGGWQLMIRDDGSTDNTIGIIRAYGFAYPDKIRLIDENGPHLGATLNFGRLLESADSDYIMFCDQDDVWLGDKIQLTLDAMRSTEERYPEMPILVHTDLTVVDDKLNTISDSLWNYQRLFPDIGDDPKKIMAQNVVTGCTMMINKRAKEISIPVVAEAIMYDWWVAIKVASVGKIVHIPTPSILYRQHFNNEIGAKRARSVNIVNFLKKLCHLPERLSDQYSMIARADPGAGFWSMVFNKAMIKISQRTR
jgi:glycosyltransferase involved in cell wall biosynthesis